MKATVTLFEQAISNIEWAKGDLEQMLVDRCDFPPDYNLHTHGHDYQGLVAYALETPQGSPDFQELRRFVVAQCAVLDAVSDRLTARALEF